MTCRTLSLRWKLLDEVRTSRNNFRIASVISSPAVRSKSRKDKKKRRKNRFFLLLPDRDSYTALPANKWSRGMSETPLLPLSSSPSLTPNS
jgi:hypothetical protein